MKSSDHRAAKPFVSLRETSFLLGERIVFENTSWCIRNNEQWAILGTNNSGKSLLADGLRGLLPVAHGQVRYHFRPAAGLSAEGSIAHVSFEERKLNVHDTVVQSRWNSIEDEGALRVRDFLSYDRVMDVNPFEVTLRHEKARSQFEKRMRRAAALLQVGPFLERTLMSLSNGETQRVQLARALAYPMRLLILDEPFAGLDRPTRSSVHHVLERLMASGLRIVLITTRPEDLPRQVTHVACVKDCRVVRAGHRAYLLSQPEIRELLTDEQPAIHRPKRRHRSPPWSPMSFSKTKPRGSKGINCAKELVQMTGVTVRYGDSAILQNIDWVVRARESWALLGANGSGKTALLSLILRDNPQVYGNKVRLFGEPSGHGESIWELKSLIGWVSPELHLYLPGSATCLEVVLSGFFGTMGLYETPSSSQRSAALRWLDWMNLAGEVEEPLFTLSVGLQRMVLLARALVKQPRLLILDEPCQGLDPGHRQLFVETVDVLVRSVDLTAIFVTHCSEEIPKSIRRVLHLDSGRATQGYL